MAKAKRETTRTPGVFKVVGARRTIYEARWRALDPDTGKREQYSETFDKLEQAEAYLDQVRQARHDGTFVPRSKGKRPYAEVFAGWLDAKPRKESTNRGYRNVYDRWLSGWADRPVASLGYDDVRSVMNRVVKAGRASGTVRKVFVVINASLGEAVREGCIAVNPAERYRRNLPSPRREREPHPLDAAQVAALAEKIGPRYSLFIRVAAWSGLRRSELIGLRVRDVHVLNAEVQVLQAVHPVKGGGYRVDTPKSAGSTGRRVPLPPALARELGEVIAARQLQPDDYVFGEEDGRPHDRDHFYKYDFKPALRALGLGDVRFHDLRHTFAALKLAQNYRLDQIKNWMGHHSIAVTVDLYGSWVPNDTDAMRQADDAAYLAAQPATNVLPLRPPGTG